MRGYSTIVRLHIGPTIGAAKLSDLSTPMLVDWRDRLLSGTKQRPAVSRRLARKILGILGSILKDAQNRGLVAQNVALPVTIEAKKREVKQHEVGVDVPGKTDIQKLVAIAAEPRWARLRPLLVLPLPFPECAPQNSAG
jgi:integrase